MMISCKYSAAVKGYILAIIMVSTELNGTGLQFKIDYPRKDENGLVEGGYCCCLLVKKKKKLSSSFLNLRVGHFWKYKSVQGQ
jgi:hypothetical protein